MWYHETSLSSPLFVEMTVPRQKSKRSCICVLGVSILLPFYNFSIWFWNCSDSVVFFVLFFILFCINHRIMSVISHRVSDILDINITRLFILVLVFCLFVCFSFSFLFICFFCFCLVSFFLHYIKTHYFYLYGCVCVAFLFQFQSSLSGLHCIAC